MKKILQVLVCSFLLFSCSKDDDDGGAATQILRYDETFCADEWGGSLQTDSITLSNLRSYLDGKGLYHSTEVVKTERGPDLCSSCFCRTGKVIYVRTLVSQQQAYLDLRFHY